MEYSKIPVWNNFFHCILFLLLSSIDLSISGQNASPDLALWSITSSLITTSPLSMNSVDHESLTTPSIPVYPANAFLVAGSEWNETVNGSQCPCRECGYDHNGHMKIICDTGGIVDIPFERISPLVQIIDITAPDERPNNLTLGPLFYQFPQLKRLRISNSNIPAIGATTFRFRTSLLTLDLSQNRIKHLIDANFRGLSRLKTLNLSSNHLSELASGTFRQLYNLRHLSLSHNRLTTITTRLFYNLTSLETLDLSYNLISEIPPKNIIDLRPLKHLSLANCQLRQLHSLFYHNLPNLQTLDLRDNLLNTIHVYEFSSLHMLRKLWLDRNQLCTIEQYAFSGLNLDLLSLSHNHLMELNEKTFANCSVIDLNLSYNNFTGFDSKIFEPLGNNLQRLSLNNIESLIEPWASVTKLLSPLKILNIVELCNLRLDSSAANQHLQSSSSFSSIFGPNIQQTLRHVNLSHNSFVNITARMFDDLINLEVLDLSHNSLYELSSQFLYVLSSYKNLTTIYLDNNPWSCYRCHLLYFRNWITTPNTNSAIINQTDNDEMVILNPYQNACQLDGRCAICRYPPNLEDNQVDKLEEWQLEWCTDPTVQLRVSTTEPNVGLVLALLIIIILIIVIIGVIVYYRNRGAIYFTNEELLYGRASTIGGDDGNGYHGGKHHGSHADSHVYNISNAIRYFADATASPPDDSMSVTSMDSLYHPGGPNHHHHHHHHSLGVNGPYHHSLNRSVSGHGPHKMIEHKTVNGQLYAKINNHNRDGTASLVSKLGSQHQQASFDSIGGTNRVHQHYHHSSKTLPRLSSDQSNQSSKIVAGTNGSGSIRSGSGASNSLSKRTKLQANHSNSISTDKEDNKINLISNNRSLSRQTRSVQKREFNQSSIDEQHSGSLSSTNKTNMSGHLASSNKVLIGSNGNNLPVRVAPKAKIHSLSSNSTSTGSAKTASIGGGNKKPNKTSTPLVPPPPPPPTSSSSHSSSSTATQSTQNDDDDDDDKTETDAVSLDDVQINQDGGHQHQHHKHRHRRSPQNDDDDDDRSPTSTLCPYEQVEDEEDDDIDVSTRSPSPSGSIDLSPPTELPIMRQPAPSQQGCHHHSHGNEDCCSYASIESLTTAAMAENGDNDSISNCSMAQTSGQSSLDH